MGEKRALSVRLGSDDREALKMICNMKGAQSNDFWLKELKKKINE